MSELLIIYTIQLIHLEETCISKHNRSNILILILILHNRITKKKKKI